MNPADVDVVQRATPIRSAYSRWEIECALYSGLASSFSSAADQVIPVPVSDRAPEELPAADLKAVQAAVCRAAIRV